MSKTTVVHYKHEPYDVYIGRPSKWGNPFSRGTRDENIARYEEYILEKPELMSALHELKGKTLGCWCAPKACHGHVLARLADALEDAGKKQKACPNCGKEWDGIECDHCGMDTAFDPNWSQD